MTATDDAREVLAAHSSSLQVEGLPGIGAPCLACAEPWPCVTGDLARTLLALTGEQAVEAGTVVLREASGGWWDDGVAEDVVRAVLDAALAAAEEARPDDRPTHGLCILCAEGHPIDDHRAGDT